MCDDGHGEAAAATFSRRRLLQGAAGAVALAALAGCGPGGTSSALARGRVPGLDGLTAYALAMHLHASASEGIGSMRAQLAQAAQNGFDVAWFTEHDWRRLRMLFRPSYHFVDGDTAVGGVWALPRLPDVGSLTSDSGGALVATPVSPNDPAATKGSLRLAATSTGDGQATVGFSVDAAGASRANYAARITGRTISVDVYPTRSGPGAWGELLFRLSRQVAGGTRPYGQITMLYRFRPDVPARTVSTEGSKAIIDVPVPLNAWSTITLDLTSDVAAAWSDLDARDNSLHDIEFHAASSNGAPAEVFFGYLRFQEQAGYDALGVEHDLLARYAPDVPGVLGLVGTEISFGPHLNQFGGDQLPYDYGTVTSLAGSLGEIRPSIVDFIHANRGIASVNHPFMASDSSVAATPTAIARDLLSVHAAGADLLEVGYAAKGTNGTLAHHLAVWDALSRNGLFLTGNGVSDDHTGDDWAHQPNRFYTAAFARGRDESTLVDALRRGRSFVGLLGAFDGTIDMAVDSVPMGSVSTDRSASSRTLRLDVTGLPSGGAVQVLRGAVDYAGTSRPTPNTTVLKQLGASDLGKSSRLDVDTREECFLRAQVVDRSGDVVAFGQPVWLLHGKPATGIPAARSA